MDNFFKLYKMVSGYQLTQSIFAIVKAGIPDLIISNNAESIESLAKSTDLDEEKLYRIMLALSSEGIFQEEKKYSFKHTELSKHLTSGEKANELIRLRVLRTQENYYAWSKLYEGLKTNRCPFDLYHKKNFFDYLEEDADSGNYFNQCMFNLTSRALPFILEFYSFSSYKTILDIGGGYGQLMYGILKEYPEAKGIIYDLPEVIAGALDNNKEHNVNIEWIGGSFFDSLNVNADLFILRNILHNWPDEDAIKILKNCCKVMKPGNKLLVIENKVSDHGKGFNASLWKDLEMLVYFDGRERNEREISELLYKAGLSVGQVISTNGMPVLIEARLSFDCFDEE